MRFEEIKKYGKSFLNRNRLIKSIFFLVALLAFVNFGQTRVEADTSPNASTDSDVTVNILQFDGSKKQIGDVTSLKIPYASIKAGTIDDDKLNSISPYKLIRPSSNGPLSATPDYTSYGLQSYGLQENKQMPATLENLSSVGSRTTTNTASFINNILHSYSITPMFSLSGKTMNFDIYYYDPVKINLIQKDDTGKDVEDPISFSLDPGGSFKGEETTIYQGNTLNNINNTVNTAIANHIPTNRSLISSSYQDDSSDKTDITDQLLADDNTTLKDRYSDTSSVSSKDGSSIVNLLAKSFALTGDSENILNDDDFISGSSNSDKTRTITLVYGPEKENKPSHNNSGSSSGSSGITRNIEGVELHLGTYKDASTVKIYDDYGSQISDRELAPGTNWYADEQMNINGVKYYRVATDQWVKTSDIYIYYNRKNNVHVNDHIAMLLKSSGKKVTNRALQKNSDWYSDRYMYINNIKYYRVATNEFVSANDVTEY